MTAPPLTRTRAARLRALAPGQETVVRGTADQVCVAAHKALGRGNYQVRELPDGRRCRVWHLTEEQRRLKQPTTNDNLGSE
jgi:hypothetical protein